VVSDDEIGWSALTGRANLDATRDRMQLLLSRGTQACPSTRPLSGRDQGVLMGDSTLYTIGTALSRAQDGGVPVAVLVEGTWLTGQVVGVDGHGVILAADGAEHSVVRIESISAVRVLTSAPGRRPNPATLDHPIPAPRYANATPMGSSPWHSAPNPS